MDLGVLEINGVILQAEIRRNVRAKRLSLRLDPLLPKVIVTIPRRVALFEAKAFLNKCHAWIASRLPNQPKIIPFVHGNVLPILGQDCTIRYEASKYAQIVREDNILWVSGKAENIDPLVRGWLYHQANVALSQQSHEYAARLNASIHRVSVREVKSRWGSCTKSGKLSFSWRLILAPTSVLEYVCVHEVAHLKEMNHSSRFWKIVEGFCPDYKVHRHWLRTQGRSLFLYGAGR